MILISNKKTVLFLLAIVLTCGTTQAQFGKKKSKNKFECGYVHKKTLKERLNVSSIAGAALAKFFIKGSDKFDFGTTAVTIARSNHIYPQGYVDMPFKIDGWEACGSSIGAFGLSKLGLPMIKIPSFSIDGTAYEPAALGQYVQAFPHTDQSPKTVVIKDNNGKSVEVIMEPIEGFLIKSVNGVSRWDTSLTYDGTEDMIIELDNKIDPEAKIGVELHNKITATRFNSPIFFSTDKNTITIPKEAFRNALKYTKDNMLIIYKYKENVLDEKSEAGGAIRTVNSYYDFTPITIGGDLTKSILIKGWKKENNKVTQKDLSKETKYDFEFKKADPLYYHPSTEIKSIAIPSFVVRGNLKHKHVDIETQSSTSTTYTSTHKITSTTTTKTTRTLTKWFPKLNKDTWQNLSNRLYDDFKEVVAKKYNAPVTDLKKIIVSKSYKNIIPILDTVTKNFVEVGAYGSQRVLPSIKNERNNLETTGNKSAADASKMANKGGETTIPINTFPSDFLTTRVMNEFNTNCAITVNFDLEFDIQKEALLPIVSIKFYAPHMNMYNNLHYYQEVQAYFKESISLKESAKSASSTVDQIYNMINAPRFFNELMYTLEQIAETEKETPAYQIMWDAMH